jgi:hypothetical protein
VSRIYPINERPYIELIRYADMDDKLSHAFDFIDEVIKVFIRYGDKGNGQALIDICKQGLKAWKKICRYDIVVHTDEDGYEYLLESQTFSDYMMNRFLNTSRNKSDYDQMKITLIKIYKHLKWAYNDPGPYIEEEEK